MANKAFRRAMHCLSHPVSIGALIVLLLNDHVWRRAWPSWLTGKLGDFTWLIFAPFLLAAILAWLIPSRIQQREARIGQLAIVITGLVFGLAKTIPAFHAVTIWVLETLTGWPNVLRRDPTDLLALPALLLAWQIWKQCEARRSALPSKGLVLLPLAVLATMADSPAPDYGITDLEMQGSTIFAGEDGAFESEDGGLSWQGEGYGARFYEDQSREWRLKDPSDPHVQYRFVRGESIERSRDGGQTWQMEIDLRGDEARRAYIMKGSYYGSPVSPLDTIIHSPTGNLVVAMGQEGVLVRTADGEWHWVTVGDYSAPELNRVDQVVSLLSGEMWLALALSGLAASSLAQFALVRRALKSKTWRMLSVIPLVIIWIGWLFIAIIMAPAATGGYSVDEFAAVGLAVLAIPFGLGHAAGARRRYPGSLRPLLIVAVSVALLYLLPYVVWSQGGIPRYASATLYAVVLVAATLFTGHRYLQRLPVTSPMPIESDQSPHEGPRSTQSAPNRLQPAGRLLLWFGLLMGMGGIIATAAFSFLTPFLWLPSLIGIIGGVILIWAGRPREKPQSPTDHGTSSGP